MKLQKMIFTVFDGKIKGRVQSARRLLVYVNEFCTNTISKYFGVAPIILVIIFKNI